MNARKVNICGRTLIAGVQSATTKSITPALGTMSVSEALRAFSTETVVAGKHAQPPNARLASELPARSAFMRPLEGSPYRDEKM